MNYLTPWRSHSQPKRLRSCMHTRDSSLKGKVGKRLFSEGKVDTVLDSSLRLSCRSSVLFFITKLAAKVDKKEGSRGNVAFDHASLYSTLQGHALISAVYPGVCVLRLGWEDPFRSRNSETLLALPASKTRESRTEGIMARFGEGDKRWIVADRPDGRNVHNWHWVEKDCLEWSKKTLRGLLENQIILNGEGNLWIKTTEVDKIEGEAYVNVRKGKLIPGYELCVRVLWQGEAKDSDGNTLAKADGQVDLPYISVENADEDPEILIKLNSANQDGERFKDAFVAKGKCLVLSKVNKYVELMLAGAPAKDDILLKSKSADRRNGQV